jgi:hypothetical protein
MKATKTQATVLATALTGVLAYVLAQVYDLTIDQAVATHVSTIISTLIALFLPPPSGGSAIAVSPRTQADVPVEQPAVFTEELSE